MDSLVAPKLATRCRSGTSFTVHRGFIGCDRPCASGEGVPRKKGFAPVMDVAVLLRRKTAVFN
jgi:hypothetical protein